MNFKQSDKINEGVLQASKKISKTPKTSSSPCRTQDPSDPLEGFDKGNLTFPEEDKLRYMEEFKIKLRDIGTPNLTLESSVDIDWVNLLKELNLKRFNQLIEQILPSSVFIVDTKVQVLRRCRKNIIRWFQNENNEDNRGGRLVHEEDDPYFYDQVKMIIKGMTERKPAELQEKVQEVLAPLFLGYGKELKGNEFSKNKKSAYLNANPKLKRLWQALPYPKKTKKNSQELTTLPSERIEIESPFDFDFGSFCCESPGRKTYEELQREFFYEGSPLCNLSQCGFDL